MPVPTPPEASPVPVMGLRERRQLQTRADISRAAIDLSIERGYVHITVEEIAAAAGVSPRTFFNYFPSKRDALLAWSPSPSADAIRSFVAAPGSLLDDLRALVVGQASTAQATQGEMRRLYLLMRANPGLQPLARDLFREFEVTLAAAVLQRPDASARESASRTVAAIATAILRSAFSEWLSSDPDVPIEIAMNGAFDALASLSTPGSTSTPILTSTAEASS